MLRELMLCLALAGCGTGGAIITPVAQVNAPVAVPVVQPMTLNPVVWQVMSVTELKIFVSKLQLAQQNNIVVFILDTKNYTNLTLNLVEVQRYLKEQQAILDMLNSIIASRSASSDIKH